MKWILKTALSLGTLFSGVLLFFPTAAFADAPRTLVRTVDAVEIPGHAMAVILGVDRRFLEDYA